MTIKIYKEFTFEAAHLLPNVPEGHKCGRLHGHSYVVKLHFKDNIDPLKGWFIDFSEVKVKFKPILDQLDHRYLNEIKGLENPTAEVIAMWIWKKVKPIIPQLCEVELNETCTCGVSYKGK
ncbi:6-carboxytetrahydropterin synthase QueD [Rheinheimera sp. UJ63]|uniref:6-carboxytetrahydropterin synthase QueD n=1 Tax=Rheinheimera sp. UJ63 TaxID=2910157 RepID=UPI001F2AABCA|nr:6-carboxytetrahydropterin synthase QueD [Rheinheimera sp. UJ63]MCF4010625.1 6-carboxytetrahydropterin synthase QueD [Rheinheimera sp. UJ63]